MSGYFSDAIGVILSFDQEVYEIVKLSLMVSLTSTLIATTIGTPLGILLSIVTFPLKNLLLRIIYTFMAIPPVVMGLFVMLLIMNKGPLGSLGLLFSPTAMVIAQTLLVLPIITGNIINSTEQLNVQLKETCKTLGGSTADLIKLILLETRAYIIMAVTLGFSRAISEVGAVMLVGGNIRGKTRVMTTYISLNNSMGEHAVSIAMAIILLGIAFVVNAFLMHFRKVVAR